MDKFYFVCESFLGVSDDGNTYTRLLPCFTGSKEEVDSYISRNKAKLIRPCLCEGFGYSGYLPDVRIFDRPLEVSGYDRDEIIKYTHVSVGGSKNEPNHIPTFSWTVVR